MAFDPGTPFEYEAGQFVNILIPEAPEHKALKRPYSIASSPIWNGFIDLCWKRVKGGIATNYLWTLKEGDKLTVQGPLGRFTLRQPLPRNIIFVSTGTGIAPFISMLRTPSAWSANRKISILHGVRFPKDLGYRDEIVSMQSGRKDSLMYFPVVSREDGTSWNGIRGHVQKLFSDGTIKLDPAKDHVYLCGNPAMITDVETLLLANGYTEHKRKQPGNLHLEKYW